MTPRKTDEQLTAEMLFGLAQEYPRPPILLGLAEAKRRLLEWVDTRVELDRAERLGLERLMADLIATVRRTESPF